MWVFTSKGFISAVAHRKKPDHLLVRARRLEHLKAIFPGLDVHRTDNADYKYRVTIHRDLLAAVMSSEIARMTYDNFKNSIVDHEYHDACSTVWRVMHELQPGSYMPPLPDLFKDTPPEGDQACPDCEIEGHMVSQGDGGFACTFCGSTQWTTHIPQGNDCVFGDPDKCDDRLPRGMD